MSLEYLPGKLGREQQVTLLRALRAVMDEAPLFTPTMPRSGKPMSVRMTGFGPLCWITDARGYRYEPRHPETGQPWPPMPEILLDLWKRYAPNAPEPDACLANLYRDGAKMGLHQDRDEQDFTVPVLSLSLGDTAVFRIGGTSRSGPTTSLKLNSGDLCLLAGPARLAFHGVDRVLAGSSTVVPGGGRLNLTLRRALK